MTDLEMLAKLVGALGPWLDQVVIVGGWAHRLHRLTPQARPPGYEPIRTLDADVAFAERARLTGDIGQTLRNAGFHEEFAGEHQPPVTWYRLGKETGGFYAEFLTPLSGSGTRRDGTPDATVKNGGVTAQKLRHLDLLLMHPWQVTLGGLSRALSHEQTVRIPNPVTFIAQKLLIFDERPNNKRAQDVLYVHDTLELFGHDLSMLVQLWRAHVRPTLTPLQCQRIRAVSQKQFSTVTDVHRNAARIPTDRTLRPENVQARCMYGLAEMFAE